MNGTLEPRDGGAILGETFRIYGRNWLRLCAITAAVAVILYAWYFVMTMPSGSMSSPMACANSPTRVTICGMP